MKTFEERYAAWSDGLLSESELASFGREMESRARGDLKSLDLVEERPVAIQMRTILRKYAEPARLQNADFFSAQIAARVRTESRSKIPVSQYCWFPFLFTRISWVAAACAVVGISAYFFAKPGARPPKEVAALSLPGIYVADEGKEDAYRAQILDASSDEPGISVTPVHSDTDDVTVIWVDGLDYLPASYQLE